MTRTWKAIVVLAVVLGVHAAWSQYRHWVHIDHLYVTNARQDFRRTVAKKRAGGVSR